MWGIYTFESKENCYTNNTKKHCAYLLGELYIPCQKHCWALWSLPKRTVFIFRHLYNEAERDSSHFTDSILKYIFLNENVWIAIEISLKFVATVSITKTPALVQIMAWCRPGDNELNNGLTLLDWNYMCNIGHSNDIPEMYVMNI